jgi:hypothetical protein
MNQDKDPFQDDPEISKSQLGLEDSESFKNQATQTEITQCGLSFLYPPIIKKIGGAADVSDNSAEVRLFERVAILDRDGLDAREAIIAKDVELLQELEEAKHQKSESEEEKENATSRAQVQV